MTFEDLGIESKICEALKNFGFCEPTEVQAKSIPTILQGKDVVIRSQTGSGKTFAFALPILQNIDCDNKCIQALVLCPTRELAMQVADEFKKIAEQIGVGVCAVFGGSSVLRQIEALKKKPQVVVGTTGRVMDLLDRNALKIESAKFVVLDEADEMLDMGFRPDIEKIFARTQKSKQTLLFSATIPQQVKALANNFQNDAVFVELGRENEALDKIEQKYMFVEKKFKKEALKELIFSEIFEKAIVFVNTKAFAEDIEHFLKKSKIECRAIHGDMRQSERKRVVEAFKSGKILALVATDVASRGLDIKGVKYVINFDLPQQIEFYVHRIGRTARAGESGTVIDIVTSLEQLSYLKQIEKLTSAKIEPLSTNSQNLCQFFVDTKQLAKRSNRFLSKAERFDGAYAPMTSKASPKRPLAKKEKNKSNFAGAQKANGIKSKLKNDNTRDRQRKHGKNNVLKKYGASKKTSVSNTNSAISKQNKEIDENVWIDKRKKNAKNAEYGKKEKHVQSLKSTNGKSNKTISAKYGKTFDKQPQKNDMAKTKQTNSEKKINKKVLHGKGKQKKQGHFYDKFAR